MFDTGRECTGGAMPFFTLPELICNDDINTFGSCLHVRGDTYIVTEISRVPVVKF